MYMPMCLYTAYLFMKQKRDKRPQSTEVVVLVEATECHVERGHTGTLVDLITQRQELGVFDNKPSSLGFVCSNTPVNSLIPTCQCKQPELLLPDISPSAHG